MVRAVAEESYIGRRIRLRDLHVFFTVTQCGSMAKAAAELGITQPAVSRVIAQLEHALGVRLLDRNSQGVEPTMYGRALLSRGGVAFDELKQAIRDIEFLASPNLGEVRIGCPETIAVILPPVVEQLSRRYPNIVPIVVGEVASPSTDFSELQERKVDLVVSRLFPPFVPNQFSDNLNVQILFDDQVVVAAGAESRWARRRKIDLADLADEPWISAEPNTWTGAIVEEAFRVAWAEAAEGLADDAFGAPSHKSRRHRPLYRCTSGFGDEPLWPAVFAEGATGRASWKAMACSRRNLEEPDIESGGQALYRASGGLLEVAGGPAGATRRPAFTLA